MDKLKRTDRKIIMDIIRQTKHNKIYWYKSTFSDNNNLSRNSDMWKSRTKISKNKSLLITLVHNKKTPYKSLLNIHIESRSKTKNQWYSKTIKVRTIINIVFIMFLLRYIMVVTDNSIVKKSLYGIIRNNIGDKNEVLFINFYNNNKRKWVLPFNEIKDNDNQNNMLNIILNDRCGVNVSNSSLIKYRNIFELNNVMYSTLPYEINEYDVTESFDYMIKYDMLKWININEIHKYDVDSESLRIIDFLNNSLPF